MNRRAKRHKALLPSVIAASIAASFAGAMATLVSPAASAQNVINACYQKNDGRLRVLPASEQCKPSEVPISWNDGGPVTGISGLERVDFSTHDDSTSPKHVFAKCPTGKHVVGGGAQVFVQAQATSSATITKIYPSVKPDKITSPAAITKSYPSLKLDGWAASAEDIVPPTSESTSPNWFLTAYALCATVSPKGD